MGYNEKKTTCNLLQLHPRMERADWITIAMFFCFFHLLDTLACPTCWMFCDIHVLYICWMHVIFIMLCVCLRREVSWCHRPTTPVKTSETSCQPWTPVGRAWWRQATRRHSDYSRLTRYTRIDVYNGLLTCLGSLRHRTRSITNLQDDLSWLVLRARRHSGTSGHIWWFGQPSGVVGVLLGGAMMMVGWRPKCW